jgi:hypothetical protein
MCSRIFLSREGFARFRPPRRRARSKRLPGGRPRPAPTEPRRPGLSTREAYRPPDDGVLTVPQVETFLKVREATLRIRATPGGNAPLEGEEGISGRLGVPRRGGPGRPLALGPRRRVFLVRERILEAEAAAMTAKLNADVLALLEKTLASLRDRRPAAPDEPRGASSTSRSRASRRRRRGCAARRPRRSRSRSERTLRSSPRPFADLGDRGRARRAGRRGPARGRRAPCAGR